MSCGVCYLELCLVLCVDLCHLIYDVILCVKCDDFKYIHHDCMHLSYELCSTKIFCSNVGNGYYLWGSSPYMCILCVSIAHI